MSDLREVAALRHCPAAMAAAGGRGRAAFHFQFGLDNGY